MKKSILIIGGTGFLGFHLAKLCKKKRWKIISVSRRKPKNLRKINQVRYLTVDIACKNKLKKKLKNFLNVNYVVNFGGEVNHKSLMSTYKSHYIGSKNLADIYSKTKLDKFIQVGSSLEYGKQSSPQKENIASKPLSNYARAKYEASKYIINLSKKFKFPAITIRPYQIYGPFQDPNRFIPFIILSCLEKKTFPCSDGLQKRDFLFIDDFIKLILKILLNNKINCKILNVGFGRPTQLKKVIKIVNQKIKSGTPQYGKIQMRNEENMITYPNTNKVKKLFNWRPKVTLEKGLMKTINYFKKKR